IFPFLRAVRDLGYRLAILTNQSGVARGYYSADDYHRLTKHMLTELQRENIEIELVLACFEYDKGINPAYARQSFWRKPRPGMVLEAIRRLTIDPSRSAFLGNELTDMTAAQEGGISRCLLLTEDKASPKPGIAVVKDYNEALVFLKEPSA
ncbi:MAG: HAD-IIIA family hydrolase, partial [Bdellovibrionales bacterium]